MTDQVVTGHPRTRACFAVPFLLFVSRRFCLFRPFWPRVPLLGGFVGVPFWAPCVFGILLVLMGLELVRSPFPRPFSWDARRQGFSCASSALFSFPLVFCGHAVSRCPNRSSYRGRRWSRQPLGGVTPRGMPNLGRGLWTPPFWGFCRHFFVCQRVTGTLGCTASRDLCVGEGAFFAPPQVPFFHNARFLFPPQVFFPFFWPSRPASVG